jgi:hypothetical protein
MTPAELYYFICKCLAMNDDPELQQSISSEVSKGNVPWEEFVWMGSSHFVLPALYSAFRRNGILPLLPDDLVEHLSGIYTINEERNKQILEQSRKLIRMLNKEGIEPVFLKGAGHLLQNLYYDLGDRIMSDIDILIPEDVLPKAAKLLYDNGYFHPEEIKDDDFEKHHHLPGFEHKNEAAMVEIHHSVFPGNFRKFVSNMELFSEKKKIEGTGAWVLSVKHQQLLNFVHDQLVDDGFRYKSMVIKGLYDFYLLSKLNPITAKGTEVIRYKRPLNTYCFFVSSAFNDAKSISFTENLSAGRFRKQFDYLLNHPKISGLYQIFVVYSLRIPIILKTFITAPFSKQSRRYFNKKAGSSSALRRYFKNLKEEI